MKRSYIIILLVVIVAIGLIVLINLRGSQIETSTRARLDTQAAEIELTIAATISP